MHNRIRFRFVVVFFLILISAGAYSQKTTVKGHVLDTLDGALPSATVLLLKAQDSTLINFSVTDAEGKFALKNVSKGAYLLRITFVGYATHAQKIATSEAGDVVDVGKIILKPQSKELDEVTVEGHIEPVVVKRDTIEFNALAFKTVPNAMVEDLLKKLPGVEVDNDGNITAQGEQVQRVTVDGKNFFGNDPKIATRNLPADAINKVQVFDKKSDQAAFTGIDDGEREKTINLELKEEKRNGAFGNLTGGVGTDDRFLGKASLNRFRKDQQLSVLGMGNNTNEQGFSLGDYMNFTGGSQQLMGGGGAVTFRRGNRGGSGGIPMNLGNRANGLMTSYAGGLNVNNQFSKNTELNGSYFYNYLDHNKLQTTYRENFLPAGSYVFEESAEQNNTNENHRANMTLDHRIDSANSVKFISEFTFNQTDAQSVSSSRNTAADGSIESENDRVSLSDGALMNFNSSVLLRHRFNKKGRTLSSNLSLGLTQNDRDGSLDATNRFYTDGVAEESVIRQTSRQATGTQRYGVALSYTEPLGGRKYLEANYNYQRNLNDVDKAVYDVVNNEETVNTVLSNKYNSDYMYQRAGLNVRVNHDNYTLTAGGSWQRTGLTGDLELQDVRIDKTFENFLPSVRFNYDFSMTRHLGFDYETSMEEPTIQQLQPVVDNSDPLNISVGNPALRPAYKHNWRLNFMSFSPASFFSFFSFVNVDYIRDDITNSRSVDEQLVTTTMPVNVDNSLNVNINATVAFPIDALNSRLSVSGNRRDSRSITVLNDQDNTTVQKTTGGNIRYNYRYKEILDLTLSANLNHQVTAYEFDQPDQTYFNQTYQAETDVSFLRNYQFNASLNYLVYNSKSSDFNQSIPLMNVSVSRFLLKNKSGELKLSVNNLLDEALGVNQEASINYLERVTTNSLGCYFMVSFTYALNKHLNPMPSRRRGRGMPFIHQEIRP